MNKELLQRATQDDREALAELRRAVPASLTVFVATDGDLDIDATLAAWQYWQTYGVAPTEWDDAPTLTLAQAFPSKVRRDPIRLLPVTPGVWSQLWESDSQAVAAIHWAVRTGAVRDSELELRGRISRHMQTPDPLVLDVLRAFGQLDGDTRRHYERAVSAPMEQAAPATPSLAMTPRGQGRSVALDELEALYQRGELDVARYLKLKESMTTSDWSLEKFRALSYVVMDHFNLSEVHTLAFSLGCDSDNLPTHKSGAARELCLWARRKNKLDLLSEQVKAMNPGRWVEFAAEWMS